MRDYCGVCASSERLAYSQARDEMVCDECVAYLAKHGYYPDEPGRARGVTVEYEFGERPTVTEKGDC